MVGKVYRYVLQGIYPWMLLVSLSLHVVVLLWPLPQPPQPSPRALKVVKLTDLVAPRPPAPRQAELRQPTVHTTPKLLPSNAQTEQSNRLTSAKLSVVASKARTAPVATPAQPPAPSPNRPSPNTPSPNAPASSAVTAFLKQLASESNNSANSDQILSSELFADPSLFFAPNGVSDRAKLKPDILRAAFIAGKTPVQVYVEILVTQGQSENFQVFERGTYGQGLVYEVKQGQQIWYFNLVPTKQVDGTVLVVWQHDPSLPL